MKGSGTVQSPKSCRFAVPVVLHGRRREDCPKRFCSLVACVHFEHMADRRNYEAIFVSEIQTVQAVDELRAVGHVKLAGVAIENIESHGAEHRVPQRWSLLEDVPWRCFTAWPVPRAPLVHDEFDAVLSIELTHDLPVLQNQSLHAFTLAQNLVPVHGIKLNCVTLPSFPIVCSPPAKIPRVMVKRPTVDAAELRGPFANHLLEEAASPVPVIGVRTRGDQRQRLAVARHPSRVSAEFSGIFLRRKVPSTPPGFISYAPVAHVVRLQGSGLGALLSKRGAACRRIAVLHPPVKFRSGQAANVGSEVRLRTNEFAEMDELIGAEFVGFIFVAGLRFVIFCFYPEIRAPRAFFGWTNPITPVIAVCEASSRIANDRRSDLFHLIDQVFANAVGILNFGFCADPHPVVDGASQVFREMAVEIGRNRAHGFIKENLHSRIGTLRGRCRNPPVAGEGEPGSTSEGSLDEFSAILHAFLLLRRSIPSIVQKWF